MHGGISVATAVAYFVTIVKTYNLSQGILTEGGRFSTVDLLIKVACFVNSK